MLDNLSLRPIRLEDMTLLFRIYASTREAEMLLTDWDDTQKQAFLAQQFDAQHRNYQQVFPDASFDVLLEEGEPIGRLYVDRPGHKIHIIDIAVLPEHQGRGVGTSILRDLSDEADRKNLPLFIHVEQNNPALELYQRLGFEKTGESGVYFSMRRSPVQASDKKVKIVS